MKRLPALVCALFIFILLGSCTKGTDGSQTAKNSAAAGASQALGEADAGAADPAVAQQPARTVAIRVRLTPEEEDAMQMLADDFNATNGQGITVVIRNEYTPEDEYADDFAEEYADGEAEDAETGADRGDPASGAPAALLLDDVKTIRTTRGLQSLNERIAADYGNDPDVPATLRGEAETGGEQFGVLFDLDGYVFYYNATLYEALDLAPPETWDDLLKAGAELIREEDCPVMATDSLTVLAELLLRLKGISLTDGKRAGFSGKAGEEAFEFLLSMLNDDCLLLADRGTCKDLFLQERTAGYLGTGSDLADMYRTSGFEIGAVPMPQPEAGGNAGAPCTVRALALYPGDKEQQDAAWAFVRYLTDASVTARWAVATGHFPVRSAAYLEPEYTSYTETSVAANASTAARYGWYLPKEYSEDLQYRVREIIGRNMKSNVTGKEIAQILTEEINDSLTAE